MPTAVDQVADSNGVELARLSKLYPFPQFVKQANQEILQDRKLPPSAYADPVRSQFPCDTKAGTWLSALFFEEKRAEFHPKDRQQIEQRLDGFARYWRIQPDITAMRTKRASLLKEPELPDTVFAWLYKSAAGEVVRKLKVRNAMEVKAAAEWLEAHRDEVLFRDMERGPRCDRHTMARFILEKAAHFGAAIAPHVDFLEKQAGRGVCAPEAVVAMLRDRSILVKNADYRAQVERLAETVKTQARQALQPDMLIKLAATVEMLDRSIGLTGKYTASLPRPEDVLFAATFTKAAAEVRQTVALTSGKVYSTEAFSKLGLDDIRNLFGQDLVQEVRNGLNVDPVKMAEIARTLPRGEAELLDSLLAERGARPNLRKAAAVRQGFSQADYQKMAAAYR